MKILQVVHGFPPIDRAGAENYTYQLSKGLSGRGHDVRVFARVMDRSKAEYTTSDEVYEGIKVQRIVNNFTDVDRFKKYYINEGVEAVFEKYLHEVKPDIVHIQHLIGLSSTLVSIILKSGVPMVATLHDYWFICPRVQLLDTFGDVCEGPREGYRCTRVCGNVSWAPPPVVTGNALWRFLKRVTPQPVQRFIKYDILGAPRRNKQAEEDQPEPPQPKYEPSQPKYGPPLPENLFNQELFKYSFRVQFHRQMLRNIGCLVAPSNFVKQKFLDFGADEDRLHVIYHGINTEALSDTGKEPSEKLRFGYLGTILKHKGLDVLIKAFNRLPKDRTELYIHGFGDENEKDTVSGLKKKVKNGNVFFMGGYDQDELPGILRKLDVVVVPSTWYETFNIVAREALLSGSPVIASDIGALPELVDNGRNGFLFEPGNSDDLYSKMKRFMDEPGLLERMRAERTEIKGLDEHVREMEAVYSELIARKRGPNPVMHD